MAQLGWPSGYAFMIGLIELTCLVLYLIPRTSVLGATLMTGLLGGAMATQIRAESPLVSHVLFPVYLGLLMWGGLWLRDQRLQALFPITREPADTLDSPEPAALTPPASGSVIDKSGIHPSARLRRSDTR